MTASAEDTPLLISTSYNNLLSNREGTGMLDRIAKEAFRRIGVEAQLVYTPTEQSLFDVNAGLLDCEMNRIEGMEKEFPCLIRVPEPNMIMRFVAFSTREIPIAGWESIGNLDIAVVRGWRILEEYTRGFPGVILVPTEVELFTMLHKGRVDIALYSLLTGYAALAELGFEDIRHLEPPLAEREMYMYLHENHTGLTEPLAEALRSMKRDGTYDQIVRRTSEGVIENDFE